VSGARFSEGLAIQFQLNKGLILMIAKERPNVASVSAPGGGRAASEPSGLDQSTSSAIEQMQVRS
jgi:hypothetical protein